MNHRLESTPPPASPPLPDSPADETDREPAVPPGVPRRPFLRAAVTYEHWTPAAFTAGDTDDRGFEQPATPTPLTDIIHDIGEQYAMLPRADGDLTEWWESEPFLNFRTGEETQFGLHLEQRDRTGGWRRLTRRNRARINHLLSGQ